MPNIDSLYPFDQDYCTECDEPRDVRDVSDEIIYANRAEYDVVAVHLSCGHSIGISAVAR